MTRLLVLTASALVLEACPDGSFKGERSEVHFTSNLSHPGLGWTPAAGVATGTGARFCPGSDATYTRRVRSCSPT